MEWSHFVAGRLPTNDGYSWTLPSRLGHMLAMLESRYGPRDRDYTILGIEFASDGPQLWYPGGRKHIVIQLGLNTLSDPVRACYQLAHEAVHLLAPTGGRHAPVIEEGLATCFSEDYVIAEFEREILSGMESYDLAAGMVRDLIARDPQLIHRLRAKKPAFTAWAPEDIVSENPLVPNGLADQLVAKFNR